MTTSESVFWDHWKVQAPILSPSQLKGRLLQLCKVAGTRRNILSTLYHIEPPHTTYGEPCAGSYLVVLNRKPSKIELINDIDPRITALAYCFLFCPDALLQAVEFDVHSQGLVDFLKEFTDPDQTMLELALHKLYLMYHSFSAKSFNYTLNDVRSFLISHNKSTIWAIHSRLKKMQIFSEDFRPFLDRWRKVKHGYLYVDPPFTITEGKQHYDYNFSKRDHYDLHQKLSKFSPKSVKWLLSYDKQPFIEQLYTNFFIYDIDVPYSSKVNDLNAARAKTELLISNWDISQKLPDQHELISLDSFLDPQYTEKRTLT